MPGHVPGPVIPGPVIVGGGPAGAAAAILISRAGHAVTVLERDASPSHKVCGDFLSSEAVDALRHLGVDVPAFGASPIGSLRLVHGSQVATTPLPFTAFGLTRRALDGALLRQAEVSGVKVRWGHAVRHISHAGKAFELDCGALGPIAADSVFLATGKHDLRGVRRPGRTGGPVGLKMYYALDPSQHAALRGHIELILFAGGYAGLQLVEQDQAVLCLLVTRARLQRSNGQWDSLLGSLVDECPHLAQRLAGARPLLERPLAIAGLPYGYVHAPAKRAPPGLFRLGDQARVIASLTGDGVALALASATLAVWTWLQHGNQATLYHRDLARGLASQMRVASLIHYACLVPSIQPWVLRACRAWPAVMRLAASQTRLPSGLMRLPP